MQGLSSGMQSVLVAAGLLLAVRALTYLLTARVYFTCAARRLSVSTAEAAEALADSYDHIRHGGPPEPGDGRADAGHAPDG